ncbi:LamG-like jellyroll fold domain-containing protein [Nocardioides sp. SYSU D00038]|uniref:LamG-like jellyroll fold domain-containing protein n=1 Tax=Nocardioides sp. SYSU D00038 TaxID=2812554 RepID=UPI0027DCEF31|nr:LamG-like jellyroll fold domain-containing protein [Nocardioides sp. SYSU D00038]
MRTPHRLRRWVTHLTALAVAPALALPIMAATAAPASAADDENLRVILFYKSEFHASHVQARQAVNELAAELATQYGKTLQVQETNQASAFTTENLATADAVVFAQTGGVLFNEAQRAALETYIRGGGGYMGLHYAGWSVGQSEHDVNPFYLRLVGAMSEGHPENPGVRPGRVVNNDPTHPLAAGLPAEINRSDEWYDWTVNPAPNVRTILSADESSYQSLGRQGTTHPITWCQQIDSGRSWYTGMGHEGTAYSEPFIRTQMKNGLAYSAGLLPADCSPPEKDVEGSWSGVTPWPLMPINAALTSDGKVQSFGSVVYGGTDTTPYDWTGNSAVSQGGQFEIDVWDPAQPRTLANVLDGVLPNTTYTDLFCSMQVQNPHRRSTMTIGGDDGLGSNDPVNASIGVTSYKTNSGLRNEAPMNFPRWYPTGTTMPNGDVVVQGGSVRGVAGPGVHTPEVYRPNEGNGWKALTGATSSAAYGDGPVDNAGPVDENRWWYPRAFVSPADGKLFNISGTGMFTLDPAGNGGNGELTMLGNLPAAAANQAALGRPVGATSTAAMYRPGKILQAGGGAWDNGGGGNGARAAFTVDITGGSATPVVEATNPMKHGRHWGTATILPDGDVMVTGGSRGNNNNDGYVTNAEIWDPDTEVWTEVKVPYEHARLYHSTALLLPDGRVMIGGGGAPGPRNYTDVEYYSPAYLFDGDQPATRPVITQAPRNIGYNGTFGIKANGPVSRVTLVRNGSVTHGFNNDQNFQDLEFTQANGSQDVTITAPSNGNFAPPGAYMLFVWNADGTPSVAKIVNIDPAVKMDQRSPQVVDQFEYPRMPTEWKGANPPGVVDVPANGGRMSPWTVNSGVQLVRGNQPSQGGLGVVGYHLGLGNAGSIERPITGLQAGKEYRLSLRYARDSRTAGTEPAAAQLKVGDLDTTITAGPEMPSQSGRAVTFGTLVTTFTADAKSETLSLVGSGAGAGLMVDDLVITPLEAGLEDVPVHYELDEGSGTTAANSGTDASVGDAVLTGTTGWSEEGIYDGAVDLKGGATANAVDLPDNLLQNATDFTTSFWVKPRALTHWAGLFHIGSGFEGAGSFFQIQTQTQARNPGASGLAATFKKKGSTLEERIYATPTKDIALNQWNHVAFTRTGSTGTLFLNGEQIAQRTDLTLTMTDVGPTENNWLGRNGFNDTPFNGLMDDVRVYTTALAPADIGSMYAEGSAQNTTTTVSVAPASPSPFNEPVTVSATVEDPGGVGADGTAELWVDGARVGTPVDVTDGVVEFPGVTLEPGEHEIEVRFTAAEGFRDSVGTTQHEVERPPPPRGIPVHVRFDEGSGTTAANSGTNTAIGESVLQNQVGWSQDGKFGSAVNLPGGDAASGNHVKLPNNIDAGLTDEFTVSVWAKPDALPNWTSLVQIGSSTDTFFLLQSSTQVTGSNTGFAATFKAPGNPTQERLVLGSGNDLPLNAWTHVVFTLRGSVGKIYFNGELKGTRNDFTLDLGDVGVNGNTVANMVGGTSWGDGRWDGVVDDFRLYGHEMSASQVEDLYEAPEYNAFPRVVDDTYEAVQDEVLEVDAPGVLDNDSDVEDDAFTATVADGPDHGELTLDADGGFTYTPDAGYTGTDTFTYTANDGAPSEPATVTITVSEPPNTAPVAVADAYSTPAGTPLEVTAPGLLANDTDVEGDPLTSTDVTQAAHGEVVLGSNGSFSYTPDAGYVGPDSFTYRANDGTASSAPATVSITVTKAATTVSGTAGTFTYGKAGSVSVTVTPAAAGGQAEVLLGTRFIAKATVAQGKATIALPARSLVPGTHRLTLRYVGSETHATSSSTVSVTVKKVTPALKVKAPKKVKKGKRATVKVSLTAPDRVPVTGKVTVTVKGKKFTRTIKNGKLTLKLPKAAKVGKLKVKVAYAGSPLATGVTKTVTIKVKR